ncbi:MAG TPA: hypothetical protein VF754_06670, partial [Pyrinomonadaceae bacterium]
MKDEQDYFDEWIDDEAETEEEEEAQLLAFDGDEEDEEDEEDELSEVRTVVMSKNGMIALLSLKTSAAGAQIVRLDPRQSLPSAQSYEDCADAANWFRRSVA